MELGVWKLVLSQWHTLRKRRVFHAAHMKGQHGAGSLEAGTQSMAYVHKRHVFHMANLKDQHTAGSLEAGTQSMAYAAQKMSLSCGKSEWSTRSWEFGSWYSVNGICHAKDVSFTQQI